jgi:precorrin-6B methylase 2
MNDRRFPASQAQRLDNPERLLRLPPAEVIGALAVQAGQTIADVGAGTGYFSLPLSRAVCAAGKVYAIDAQTEMHSLLREKVDSACVRNVELMHAEADQTSLPKSS